MVKVFVKVFISWHMRDIITIFGLQLHYYILKANTLLLWNYSYVSVLKFWVKNVIFGDLQKKLNLKVVLLYFYLLYVHYSFQMLQATILTLFFWNYSFYMYLNFGWKVSFFGDFMKKKFSNSVFLYFCLLSIYNYFQMLKTTTLTLVLWKYSFYMYLNFGWKMPFFGDFIKKIFKQRFLIFFSTFYL